MTQTPYPTPVIDAGCKVLSERVAEAFEPEWREIVARIFRAMKYEASLADNS